MLLHSCLGGAGVRSRKRSVDTIINLYRKGFQNSRKKIEIKKKILKIRLLSPHRRRGGGTIKENVIILYLDETLTTTRALHERNNNDDDDDTVRCV